MRVNLVSNPSLKTDAVGWATYSSASVARTTSDAYVGDASLLVTKSANTNSGCGIPSSYYPAVTPGAQYTASAYVKVPEGEQGGDLFIQILWYTSSGTLLSGNTSASTAIDVTDLDGWIRLAVTGTAPATAAKASLSILQKSTGTAGETFLVDAVMLEASSYAREYQDELTQAQENNAMDLALKRVPVPHLTGAELNADVALGSLVFNTVDENGVVWVITDVEGWWTLPEPQINVIERGFADGQYDVRGRFTGRAITVSGSILPPDRTKLPAARQRLLEAANLVKRGDWLRLDEGPVKACYVRLVSPPVMDVVNPRGRTNFTLQFRAADPIKYEWNPNDYDGRENAALVTTNKLVPAPTNTTVTNDGNTPVTAVFEITGPVVGPNAELTNLTNSETATIIGTLRPARSFTVSNCATDIGGLSTLTVSTRHDFRAGDEILVGGVATAYNGTWLVYDTPSDTTVRYQSGGAYEASASSTGSLSKSADVIEIDTYDREVALNGIVDGSRSQLDTIIDWIELDPGENELEYRDDNQSPMFVRSWVRTSSNAIVATIDSHSLYKGDAVIVTNTFGVTNKALTSNVATITTSMTHGVTVGTTVVVAGVDSTFDGTHTVTAVNAGTKTISYAKVASNVTSVADTGTVQRSLFNGEFAALTLGSSDETTFNIANTAGVVSATNLGPVLYSGTTAIEVTSVTYTASIKTVQVTTAAEHGLAVDDLLRVTGGNTSYNDGGTAVDIAVDTSADIAINTYTFNTSTDVLSLVLASSPGWVVDDIVQVRNMGGDFDVTTKVKTVSGSSPWTITVEAPSAGPNIPAGTAAPSDAVVARVYPVTAVTANTVSYVKKSLTRGTDLAATSTPLLAARVYQLGTGTARVSYRSGWIS